MPTFYDAMDTIYKLWHIKYTPWISEELFSLSWFTIVIAMIGIIPNHGHDASLCRRIVFRSLAFFISV